MSARGLRSALVVVAALAIAPAAVVLGAPHDARPDVIDEPLKLVLTDQTFVVPADGVLRLQYELHGDLSDVEPATTTTTTTTTSTTTTTTTTVAIDPETGETVEPPPNDLDDADDADASGAGDTEDGADDEPEGPSIELVVTSFEPVVTRDRIDSVLRGATGPAVDGARFELSQLIVEPPSNGHPEVHLDLVTATGGDSASELDLPTAGLYPVTVEIRRDGRRLTRHVTFVERLAADGERPRRVQPFGLSIVAAIRDPGPEPEPLDVVEARGRLVEIAQLGEDLDAAISVAIPPGVAASLDDDPDLSARLGDALAGSELIAVPEMQLDPSSVVGAGESDAFTRELIEGEDLLAATFPATSVRRSAWLWDAPLSTEGAGLIRQLGVQLMVMSLADYHSLDGSLPPDFTDPSLLYTVALPGDTAMGIAVVDPVSELLDPDRIDERTPMEVAVEVFAELVATRIQLHDAPRIAVLSTEHLAIPDADVLEALERLVADHPSFRFQPLSLIPNSTEVMRSNGEPLTVVFPESAGIDLVERSNALALTRTLVASTSSMLPDDDIRPSAWNAQLDLLLSTGFTDEVAAERIDLLIAELEDIPTAIGLPEPFTFTLTGDTSEITLRVANTGSTALRVLMRPDATKLRFLDGDVEVVLDPGPNTIVIPVSPLSNGTFNVTIEFVTPLDGQPVTEPLVLRARVNAITGLGQVLTGGALLVLATWWFSHFRSRRRARAARARDTHPSSGVEQVVTVDGDSVERP